MRWQSRGDAAAPIEFCRKRKPFSRSGRRCLVADETVSEPRMMSEWPPEYFDSEVRTISASGGEFCELGIRGVM